MRSVCPEYCPAFPPDGLSDEAVVLLREAWSESRTKQINTAWKRWVDHCTATGTDPEDVTDVRVVNWLTKMFRQNTYKASWFEQHASAISTKMALLLGRRIGESPLLGTFLKAVRKERPNEPRYTETFDTDLLQDLFLKKGPDSKASQSFLLGKLACMLYVNGLRGSDMARASVTRSVLSPGSHKLSIVCKTKEATQGNWVTHEVPGLAKQPKLCPHCTAQAVLDRRKASDSDSFFPHSRLGTPLTAERISKLARAVMREAGVPVNFAPHALRGAGTTKALVKGHNEEAVRRLGRWSANSVSFRKNYVRVRTDPIHVFDATPTKSGERTSRRGRR